MSHRLLTQLACILRLLQRTWSNGMFVVHHDGGDSWTEQWALPMSIPAISEINQSGCLKVWIVDAQSINLCTTKTKESTVGRLESRSFLILTESHNRYSRMLSENQETLIWALQGEPDFTLVVQIDQILNYIITKTKLILPRRSGSLKRRIMVDWES